MQFKVPQFIDVEDKIFGPFTFKEFVYLVGGGGLAYVLYKLLPFLIALPFMLIVVGFALMLTFYKINNKPFLYYVQASLVYATKSKLYVWKQRYEKHDKKKDEVAPAQTSVVSAMSPSKLKDLSWSLDVLDKGKQQ